MRRVSNKPRDAAEPGRTAWTRSAGVPLRAFLSTETGGAAALLAGALAALAWANVAPASYEHFAHGPIHFAVNDIGMVFFFALAVKEIIEARLPGGPLQSPREAAVEAPWVMARKIDRGYPRSP